MTRCSFLAALCMVAAGFSQPASADVEDVEVVVVYCRVKVNGDLVNIEVPVFLSKYVWAHHVRRQKFVNVNSGDYGECKEFFGRDGKENCRGERYDYESLTVDKAWKTQLPLATPLTIGESQNSDYWKWYYGPDYDAPGECDYTQNCHGYAYGVGDHPHAAHEIINGNGPDAPCYVAADPINTATVSDHHRGHTIRIFWKKCRGRWIISKSMEQFRESGTFEKVHSCGEGSIDVWERHKNATKESITPALPSDGIHLKMNTSHVSSLRFGKVV